MNTNGLTLEPCLEMSGQLASVARCATNRAKYPSSFVLASTAQSKKIETNKPNQRPPKISETGHHQHYRQHQQRPQQPQQQHVQFSATSASASVVTKFREHYLRPILFVGKGPKTLLLQCYYKNPARSKNYVPVQYQPLLNEELSYPARQHQHPSSRSSQLQYNTYVCIRCVIGERKGD